MKAQNDTIQLCLLCSVTSPSRSSIRLLGSYGDWLAKAAYAVYAISLVLIFTFTDIIEVKKACSSGPVRFYKMDTFTVLTLSEQSITDSQRDVPGIAHPNFLPSPFQYRENSRDRPRAEGLVMPSYCVNATQYPVVPPRRPYLRGMRKPSSSCRPPMPVLPRQGNRLHVEDGRR